MASIRRTFAAVSVRQDYVATGTAYLAAFLAEATRALCGRLRHGKSASLVTLETAKFFFERRSARESMSADIIAVQSLPYQMLLGSRYVRSIIQTIHSDGVIVDYGCGNGSFRPILRASGFKGTYVGYDIDHIAIRKLKHDSADGRALFYLADEPIQNFDVAMACNVFVYNDDSCVSQILRKLRSGASSAGALIIFEPAPAWYWEFVFDGIRLCPRSAEQMITLLKDGGWEPKELATVTLLRLVKSFLLPIAYGIIAYPTADPGGGSAPPK